MPQRRYRPQKRTWPPHRAKTVASAGPASNYEPLGGPGATPLTIYLTAAVASVTHFLTKLFLAAPANFLSAACPSHVLVAASAASLSHFLMKLVFAAPDSFFSAACASHAGLAANAAVLAQNANMAKTAEIRFIIGGPLSFQ